MRSYLNALGMPVDEQNNIHVPYWRIDIEHKADVAEEIARLYGYDKIPTGMMGRDGTRHRDQRTKL